MIGFLLEGKVFLGSRTREFYVSELRKRGHERELFKILSVCKSRVLRKKDASAGRSLSCTIEAGRAFIIMVTLSIDAVPLPT